MSLASLKEKYGHLDETAEADLSFEFVIQGLCRSGKPFLYRNRKRISKEVQNEILDAVNDYPELLGKLNRAFSQMNSLNIAAPGSLKETEMNIKLTQKDDDLHEMAKCSHLTLFLPQ